LSKLTCHALQACVRELLSLTVLLVSLPVPKCCSLPPVSECTGPETWLLGSIAVSQQVTPCWGVSSRKPLKRLLKWHEAISALGLWLRWCLLSQVSQACVLQDFVWHKLTRHLRLMQWFNDGCMVTIPLVAVTPLPNAVIYQNSWTISYLRDTGGICQKAKPTGTACLVDRAI
jgi:hypothetical protein